MHNFASARRLGRLFCCLILALLSLRLHAAAPATTSISDTVYRADGSAASGTLVISWNAFTSSDGKAVPAGRKTVKIGAAGAVSIPLVPNFGGSPDGSFYRVTYKLDDGSTSEEFWNVPAAPSTTIGAIRSKLVPATVAVQYATRQYVDSRLAEINGGGDGDATSLHGIAIDATDPVRGQSLTFDGTKYMPLGHSTIDVVRDCGAKGDGVTNDAAVLQDCVNAHPGRTIFFPKTVAGAPGACSFAKTGTLTVSSQDTVLMGEGGGLSAGATICQLDDVTALQISAIAVKVQDLFFLGTTPWTGTQQSQFVTTGTADCIHAGGPGIDAGQVAIEDVFCSSFSRHGFHLDGSSLGSVDLWRLTDVRAQNNRGDGFHVTGSDGNAGACLRCTARLNQGYGFYDISTMGTNTYITPMADGNHNDAQAAFGSVNIAASNGIVLSNGTATVTTVANHNLQTGDAVLITGNSGAAFNGKWRPITVTSPTTFTFLYTAADQSGNGGSVGYQPGQRVWVTNGFHGASYRMGYNGAIVLINPYEEGNEPPADISLNANVIGGNLAPVEAENFNRLAANSIFAGNALSFLNPNNADFHLTLRGGRTNNYGSYIDWYTGGVNAPQAKKWHAGMRPDGTWDLWDYGPFGAPVLSFDGVNALLRPQGAVGAINLNQNRGTGGVNFYGGGAAVVAAVSSSGQIQSNAATGTAPLVVASTTPVANLTLASDSQLPAISSAGKVAATALPDAQRRRICEIHIGSPGGAALTDTDDEPVSCFNDYGASLTINAVRCYADAGSPTVQLVRNDSTNVLSGALACGTASWAAADGQGGRPSISASSLGNGQWLDLNIVTAGGSAKYLRVVITMVQ